MCGVETLTQGCSKSYNGYLFFCVLKRSKQDSLQARRYRKTTKTLSKDVGTYEVNFRPREKWVLEMQTREFYRAQISQIHQRIFDFIHFLFENYCEPVNLKLKRKIGFLLG